MSEKKLLGRKTGWCNAPSSQKPQDSHAKCDGIWVIGKNDGKTYYCSCECHEAEQLAKKKVANAKKYKRDIKKKTKTIESCSEHPTYGGIRKPRKECKTCWELYHQKNPGKKAIAAH